MAKRLHPNDHRKVARYAFTVVEEEVTEQAVTKIVSE